MTDILIKSEDSISHAITSKITIIFGNCNDPISHKNNLQITFNYSQDLL